MSLPRLWRKGKLSAAVNRKFTRMIKSQPKLPNGRSAMNLKLLEDRGQCPKSSVFCINVSWEATLWERSSWSRSCDVKLNLNGFLSHGQRKILLEENFVTLKQIFSCLASVTSNVFKVDKVRPLTKKIPYILSSMVVVVFCFGSVLLPADLLLQRK